MDKIKIFSWNVNGLRAIQRKGFLKWFKNEEPSILCLQETKVAYDDLPKALKRVDGYHTYFCEAQKKGYSGVAIYSKIKPKKVEYGFGIPKFDSEGRILIADYDDFVLLNIYFPNGKMSQERLDYKLEFYDALLDHANKLKAAGRNVVICGDLNTAHKEIDLARPKARERNVGWRLDYFFINEEFKNKVKSASILSEVMGSDHCPVDIELEL